MSMKPDQTSTPVQDPFIDSIKKFGAGRIPYLDKGVLKATRSRLGGINLLCRQAVDRVLCSLSIRKQSKAPVTNKRLVEFKLIGLLAANKSSFKTKSDISVAFRAAEKVGYVMHNYDSLMSHPEIRIMIGTLGNKVFAQVPCKAKELQALANSFKEKHFATTFPRDIAQIMETFDQLSDDEVPQDKEQSSGQGADSQAETGTGTGAQSDLPHDPSPVIVNTEVVANDVIVHNSPLLTGIPGNITTCDGGQTQTASETDKAESTTSGATLTEKVESLFPNVTSLNDTTVPTEVTTSMDVKVESMQQLEVSEEKPVDSVKQDVPWWKSALTVKNVAYAAIGAAAVATAAWYAYTSLQSNMGNQPQFDNSTVSAIFDRTINGFCPAIKAMPEHLLETIQQTATVAQQVICPSNAKEYFSTHSVAGEFTAAASNIVNSTFTANSTSAEILTSAVGLPVQGADSLFHGFAAPGAETLLQSMKQCAAVVHNAICPYIPTNPITTAVGFFTLGSVQQCAARPSKAIDDVFKTKMSEQQLLATGLTLPVLQASKGESTAVGFPVTATGEFQAMKSSFEFVDVDYNFRAPSRTGGVSAAESTAASTIPETFKRSLQPQLVKTSPSFEKSKLAKQPVCHVKSPNEVVHQLPKPFTFKATDMRPGGGENLKAGVCPAPQVHTQTVANTSAPVPQMVNVSDVVSNLAEAPVGASPSTPPPAPQPNDKTGGYSWSQIATGGALGALLIKTVLWSIGKLRSQQENADKAGTPVSGESSRRDSVSIASEAGDAAVESDDAAVESDDVEEVRPLDEPEERALTHLNRLLWNHRKLTDAECDRLAELLIKAGVNDDPRPDYGPMLYFINIKNDFERELNVFYDARQRDESFHEAYVRGYCVPFAENEVSAGSIKALVSALNAKTDVTKGRTRRVESRSEPVASPRELATAGTPSKTKVAYLLRTIPVELSNLVKSGKAPKEQLAGLNARWENAERKVSVLERLLNDIKAAYDPSRRQGSVSSVLDATEEFPEATLPVDTTLGSSVDPESSDGAGDAAKAPEIAQLKVEAARIRREEIERLAKTAGIDRNNVREKMLYLLRTLETELAKLRLTVSQHFELQFTNLDSRFNNLNRAVKIRNAVMANVLLQDIQNLNAKIISESAATPSRRTRIVTPVSTTNLASQDGSRSPAELAITSPVAFSTPVAASPVEGSPTHGRPAGVRGLQQRFSDALAAAAAGLPLEVALERLPSPPQAALAAIEGGQSEPSCAVAVLPTETDGTLAVAIKEGIVQNVDPRQLVSKLFCGQQLSAADVSQLVQVVQSDGTDKLHPAVTKFITLKFEGIAEFFGEVISPDQSSAYSALMNVAAAIAEQGENQADSTVKEQLRVLEQALTLLFNAMSEKNGILENIVKLYATLQNPTESEDMSLSLIRDVDAKYLAKILCGEEGSSELRQRLVARVTEMNSKLCEWHSVYAETLAEDDRAKCIADFVNTSREKNYNKASDVSVRLGEDEAFEILQFTLNAHLAMLDFEATRTQPQAVSAAESPRRQYVPTCSVWGPHSPMTWENNTRRNTIHEGVPEYRPPSGPLTDAEDALVRAALHDHREQFLARQQGTPTSISGRAELEFGNQGLV